MTTLAGEQSLTTSSTQHLLTCNGYVHQSTYFVGNFMRFPAVKKCENPFDEVTADYKAVQFFPDTVYIPCYQQSTGVFNLWFTYLSKSMLLFVSCK